MGNPLEHVARKLWVGRTLLSTGLIAPTRPDRLVRMGIEFLRWGPTSAAGYALAAACHPGRAALIDELGTLTFAQVHERSNRLAHALAQKGVGEDDAVAVMIRNHRGFVEASVALSKLGAHALYLNTAFASPQIAEVCKRERPIALIYDEEFAELVALAGRRRKRFIAWHEGEQRPKDGLLADLIAAGDPADLAPPTQPGRQVILTSGTTGTPKGAQRAAPASLDPAAAILSKIPLKAGGVTIVAAPLFHAWGFGNWQLALGLTSTVVLRRRFDPEATLALIEQHRASTLAIVPVMLQRMLELAPEAIAGYDLSSLRAIAVSGSALPGPLAERALDAFGEKLYNLYGSTEVAWATIATPADMRAAPGTAGRPPRGTIVKLYDAEDEEVAPGESGRIFVGNELLFEGYTDGGGKAVIDGLMATGDVGHFDEHGRLFVDGRDDEMIVSGGENVFPREVEDLLAGHEAVREAAVIGVQDERFGQRLKAFVVCRAAAEPDEAELKRYVKSNLAGYKVPREIVFIDELPRNATGKVLKRELAER